MTSRCRQRWQATTQDRHLRQVTSPTCSSLLLRTAPRAQEMRRHTLLKMMMTTATTSACTQMTAKTRTIFAWPLGPDSRNIERHSEETATRRSLDTKEIITGTDRTSHLLAGPRKHGRSAVLAQTAARGGTGRAKEGSLDLNISLLPRLLRSRGHLHDLRAKDQAVQRRAC